MPWTTVTTSNIAAGKTGSATDVLDINSNVDFLGALKRDGVALSSLSDAQELMFFHGAHAVRTTSQSIPDVATQTWDPINLNAADAWDQGSAAGSAVHDTVSDNERCYMRDAGIYLIIGWVQWGVDTTATRSLRMVLNGNSGGTAGSQLDLSKENAAADLTQRVMRFWRATAGDYVQIEVSQNTGTSKTVISAFISIHKVARSTA